MASDGRSYSGESYDRHIFEANLSAVNKVQREYWTAKQVLKKKFGKREDQHVVAGDNDIDSKLAMFFSIQSTCIQLLKELEKYQKCICVLARDENQLGRFLKEQGSQDKTKAGKMMAAVGKSLCYTAQQRLQLRHPLGRLRQDIETFRYRAVSDTIMSVDKMEEERTHYRASLLWMQDISSSLDPEQYKKLEKFRKVQNEVRLNKEKFDKLKWAVCQKIDLLSASRSNLFSNTLVPYQDELLNFWEKTARTMAAVLESFNGYQHYEFKLLKDLNPTQALSSKDEESAQEEEKNEEDKNDDILIDMDEDQVDEDTAAIFQDALDIAAPGDEKEGGKQTDLLDTSEESKTDLDLFNELLGSSEQDAGTSEFAKQWKSAFGDSLQSQTDSQEKQTVEGLFDPLGSSQSVQQQEKFKMQPAAQAGVNRYLPSQLMDMHFGTPFPAGGMQYNQSLQSLTQTNHGIIPNPPTYSSLFKNAGGPAAKENKFAMPSKENTTDNKNKQGMSTWYNLFAELDPLQNPDKISGKNGDKNDDDGRAC